MTDFCFGIGSMDSKDEVPAPVLGFLAGLSSSKFSLPPVTGSDGREIVIFLRVRLEFDRLEVPDDPFGETDASESLP